MNLREYYTFKYNNNNSYILYIIAFIFFSLIIIIFALNWVNKNNNNFYNGNNINECEKDLKNEMQIYVTAEKLNKGTLNGFNEYNGMIQPKQTFQIICSLREGGVIQNINRSKTVKKGDKVIVMDHKELTTRLEQAKNTRKLIFNELEMLKETNGSQKDIRILELKLQGKKFEEEIALQNYNKAFLYAPFDGISELSHELAEGQHITHGYKLGDILDNSEYFVEFYIPEYEDNLNIGDYILLGNEKNIKAVVEYISSKLDNIQNKLYVKAKITSNNDIALNKAVEVFVPIKKQSEIYIASMDSIGFDNNKDCIYLLYENKSPEGITYLVQYALPIKIISKDNSRVGFICEQLDPFYENSKQTETPILIVKEGKSNRALSVINNIYDLNNSNYND